MCVRVTFFKENDILEALHYDTDVFWPLQWRLLWFSAPTKLKRKFVNNGTKVAKFRDTVNSAIEFTCNIAFDGTHAPRACFFTGCEYFLELCIRQGLEFGRDERVGRRGRSALNTSSMCVEARRLMLCHELRFYTSLWLKLMHHVCLAATLYFHHFLSLCDASNLFNHRTLSAPEQWSGCRPQGGAHGRRLKKDVFGTCSRRCSW